MSSSSFIFTILVICVGNDHYTKGDAVIQPTLVTSQGKHLELTCDPLWHEESDVEYLWKLNGSDVSLSPRRYLKNGNLIIVKANRFQDAGEYTCQTYSTRTQQVTSVNSRLLKIKWIEESVLVDVLSPQNESEVHYGVDLTLKCIANGSEDYRIDWSKNGERILKSNRVSLHGEILNISHITSADNGVYRCAASNEADYVESSKNFALRLPSENCATLRTISEDRVVKVGSNVSLDCVYENYDLLEWYFKENGPLKNTSRFSITLNGSLFIENVGKSDEGMYACVGVKQECNAYPSKYTIIISMAELNASNTTMLEPADVMSHVVANGGNFTIACIPPYGKPPPVISWSNRFGVIANNVTGRIRISGQNLIITNVKKKIDSGLFTCKAENLAGIVESSFNLTVSVAPNITQHPRSLNVTEGSNVSFACNYEGTPYPFTQVQWRKNEAVSLFNTSRISLNEFQKTLNLFNVQGSDAGNYLCIVNTKSFSPVKSRNAVLTVIQKLKFNPLPVAKKMELGLPNKIPCKADGNDPPLISWTKENEFNRIVPFSKHVQDINGTLYFTKVKSEDKGRYKCVASNSQGSISVTIDVDVVVTPKFTTLPKNPSEGFEGHSVRLDCTAEGDPTPTIQWDNNLVDVSQRRFSTLANGSLFISELRLSDSGIYGCTAGNSGGFNRTEVLLTVLTSNGGFKGDGTADLSEGDTVERTIVITLGAASAYILLVVVLMAWCRYRRKKKKRAYADTSVDTIALDNDESKLNQGDTSKVKETANNVQNGEVRTSKFDNAYSQYISEHCVGLEFSKKQLHSIMLLGNGELGSVYLARNKGDNDAVVMIKVLEEMRPEFSRQFDILRNVHHQHIVKLIGICKGTESPPYMILEYTDWGDLKQFLVATRKSSVRVIGNKQRPPPLTLQQSLRIVQQTASALDHLTQSQFVHKDIAARNCLITSSLNVKLTFSSLCKDTYAMEYYEIRDRLFALRWLPLESVLNNEFSSKTDVYSFACLVWEIFSKGELPFSKLSNEEVLNLLEKQELCWKLPKSTPSALTKLLNKCWSINVSERPTSAQILKDIDEIINSMSDTSMSK